MALASIAIERPVRWVEDRRENLIGAPHAKEQIVTTEIGVDGDGRFLAMRARVVGDAGAFSFNSASALIEPYLSALLMPSVYDIDHFECEIVATLTNKSPVSPYRGVGWTASHTARELLIDRIAADNGWDPADLRPAQHDPVRAPAPHQRDRHGVRQRIISGVDGRSVASRRLWRLSERTAGRHTRRSAQARHRDQPVRRAEWLGKRGSGPVTVGVRLLRRSHRDDGPFRPGHRLRRNPIAGPGPCHHAGAAGGGDHRGRHRIRNGEQFRHGRHPGQRRGNESEQGGGRVRPGPSCWPLAR